jgi:hypothetical protein
VGYDFKMYTLKAAAKQTVTGAVATLTATATPTTLTAGGRPNYGYNIVKYQWTKVSGPASFSIGTPNALTSSVSGLVGGTYVFSITTTDNNTGTITAYDTIVVNTGGVVVPGPPGASAGSDQTITLPTSSVTLTGVGLETNGTITGYQWTEVGGPNTATFANARSAQTSVSGLIAGTYTFQLTVTDQQGVTASDQVKVTVNPAATPPPTTFLASAGPDVTVTLPTTSVKLTGSATVSGVGVASCKWSQVSGPNTAGISGGGSITPTISGLIAGTYAMKVTLVSTSGTTATDQMTLTVNNNPTAGYIFTVNAGYDAYIYSPATSYQIQGSATVKGYGVSSCTWVQISGPSAAAISGGGSITPTVSKLVTGTYQFEVAIVSNTGIVARDRVNVNVNVNKTTGAVSAVNDGSGLSLADSVNADAGHSVNVYPNPVMADQTFTVEGQGWTTGAVRFTLYDLSGKAVKQVMLDNQASWFKQTIPTAGLVRGVYMLTVQVAGQKAITKKILIQ